MKILKDLPFEPDADSLLEMLHLRPGSDDAKEFGQLLETAGPRANPKALYREAFLERLDLDRVAIDGVTFQSRVLRANLDKIERVFPFIATCGREIDELDLVRGDPLRQFWVDSIKTVALRRISSHLTEHLHRRFAITKTSSMSPGSGDTDIWPIEQQRELFSLFGDVKELIGVELTDSFLMIPNKSLSGIRFPAEVDFRSCQVCRREHCPSRSAPFDRAYWEAHQHETIE